MIKKITLGITLFFSTLMFASPAYADWERVSENMNGTTYVDFDRIRTNGSYVYWWGLSDYAESSQYADFSFKGYYQGDCEMFRFKRLSYIFYLQPMGEGTADVTDSTPETEWNYPPPKSMNEEVLKQVCHSAGL